MGSSNEANPTFWLAENSGPSNTLRPFCVTVNVLIFSLDSCTVLQWTFELDAIATGSELLLSACSTCFQIHLKRTIHKMQHACPSFDFGTNYKLYLHKTIKKPDKMFLVQKCFYAHWGLPYSTLHTYNSFNNGNQSFRIIMENHGLLPPRNSKISTLHL